MNEETLFAEALGMQGAARAAFLDEHCQDDVELCKRLEGLLRAHDHPDPFLEAAAPVVTVDEPLRENAGTVIGPYKLIELIGEGGMGAVWMAQQTEPVKRLVAVKLIKAGMDSKQVISRFEAERQALALMDHPNIAKVLDAGQAPPAYAGGSPQPYFVMELIKGVPITKYCDDHHLTPRQRLEVFIPVCQAVQHAHHKGIIHRDIKPSNVLVALYDGKPVPKVIDFGVAKAAGQQLTDKTLVTGFGAIVGTLEYMSPEQAEINQLDIDTRSDIYSLGVLLYELLTGSPPFSRKALEKAGMLEMLRVIREQEPSKPSTKLSTAEGLPTLAANRGTEPAKLTKLVRGELDWIVMKALEKDRNRRYETANGFAMDVQRYLADEPVQACPPSALYRVRKFARRNKAAFAMASSIFVAVAVVAIGLGWIAGNRAAQRAKAADNFEVALQKAVELLKDGDAPRARAATERAAGLLAGAGEDELLQRRLKQMEANLDMVATLELVRLQQASGKEEHFDTLIGARAYADAFRDYDLAVMELEPAVAASRIAGSAIREQLLAALVDWGNISTNSADKEQLAAILRLADTDPWRQQVFDALANKDWPRLARMAGQPDVLGQSAVRLEALGRILAMTDIPAAVEFFRQAQRRHPDDFWINHYLGVYLAQLKPARLEEAIGYFRVAVALRPQSPGAHLNLGIYLGNHGRWAEAEAEAREAIRLQKDFALAHNNLGVALRERGEVDEAIAECREAIRIQRSFAMAHVNLGLGLFQKCQLDDAVAEIREAIRLQKDYALAHLSLGIVLRKAGLLDKASAALREAIRLQNDYAEARNALGGTLLDQANLDEAILEFREAIRLNKDYAEAHNNLGVALCKKGKLDEAIAEYREAVRLKRDFAAPHTNLGVDLLAQGHVDEAIAECQKAIAIDPKSADAHSAFGIALRAKGRLDQAITELQEALRLNPNEPMAFQRLGVALCDKGRTDEAITRYQEALRIKKNLPEVRFSLGVVLWRRGQQDEAIAEYREAIRLKKDLPEAQYTQLKDYYVKIHFNLAVALAAKSQLEEAIGEYREVLRINSDYAEAHCNLGQTLVRLGQFREAVAELRLGHELSSRNPQWKHPSAQWLREAERQADLASRLPRILKGEDRPADAGESLQLAYLCSQPYLQLNAAAASFYSEAFAADAKCVENLRASHRYNAACAASLAGCGQGKDADKLNDRERTRLRRQALTWLLADLAAWRNHAVADEAKSSALAQQMLQHWLADKDLAGVRDPEALAELPEADKWQKLWAEVKALVAKRGEKSPKYAK